MCQMIFDWSRRLSDVENGGWPNLAWRGRPPAGVSGGTTDHSIRHFWCINRSYLQPFLGPTGTIVPDPAGCQEWMVLASLPIPTMDRKDNPPLGDFPK